MPVEREIETTRRLANQADFLHRKTGRLGLAQRKSSERRGGLAQAGFGAGAHLLLQMLPPLLLAQ